MKIILTETQYSKLAIRRRQFMIEDQVKLTMAYEYPCDFRNFEHFFQGILVEMFENAQDSPGLVDMENFEFVENFVTTNLWDKLKEYYTSKCDG